MLEYGVNLGRPVVIRYPRGGEEKEFKEHEKIETGKAEIIRKGKICKKFINKPKSYMKNNKQYFYIKYHENI